MIIQVKVIPNSKENKVLEEEAGVLKIRLTATPEKGEANKALIDVLSKHFGVSKKCIIILSGHTARLKRVQIDNK